MKRRGKRTSAGTLISAYLVSNTCFVIGHRRGDDNEEGVWIGFLERRRGLVAFLLGVHKRGIQPAAVRAIHEILALFNFPFVKTP